MKIQFTHEAYLLTAVALVAAVFLISLLSIWRRHRLLSCFSKNNRGKLYGTKRLVLHAVILSLITATIAALLLGAYLLKEEEYTLYEPIDIVINMDISYSMLAQATNDSCGPSRLQMSQQQIYRFIDFLGERSTDRVGLVLFSRFGYRLVPVLTRDYNLIREVLNDFTHREISMGGLLSGTNHWDAIIESLEVLNSLDEFDEVKTGKRIVIIITDGETDGPEEILSDSRKNALTLISELDTGHAIKTYVVGIGNPVSQYLIPSERDRVGCPTEYMVQLEGVDKGELIKTQMDQNWLRILSGQLNATYKYAITGDELTEALKSIIETERIPIGIKVLYGKRNISSELLYALLVLLVLIVIVKTP